MHPAVCGPVSRLSYDGRLRSQEDVSAARRLDGVTPGVRELTVEHDGNSTDSPEEADAIVTEIELLLGTPWTDEDGTVPLGQGHVLVVTPYNAQVVTLRRRLDAAGLTDVQVGTVDKFQGRQAPVVFVSMTAILRRRRTARDLVSAEPEPNSTSPSAGPSTRRSSFARRC